MHEFQINKYITLKLKSRRTIIYIKRKPFKQCVVLALNIPVSTISDFDEIESIDELSDNQNKIVNSSSDGLDLVSSIPLDLIFWAHCSNLQAWYENEYNTQLLHRNLSFPLLKRLTEVGDRLAKRVFKEEIAKRFSSNYPPTKEYLLNEGYLDYLNHEELNTMINESDYNIRSLEDIQSSIKIGSFEQLNKIELLFYSKSRKFHIKGINENFIRNFCKIYDQEFLVGFIMNNPSILHNLFLQLIKKISREIESIRILFLKEISERLKNCTFSNCDILRWSKEIYARGYRKQAFLEDFN